MTEVNLVTFQTTVWQYYQHNARHKRLVAVLRDLEQEGFAEQTNGVLHIKKGGKK